jgi:hypothetical protein
MWKIGGRILKSELFIRNSNNDLFEIKNNIHYFLEVRDKDLVVSRDKTGERIHSFEVMQSKQLINTFKTKEDALMVRDYLYKKLKEKKDLKMEIQVMKKMKGLSQSFIETYKAKLRNEYFEFSILDICQELGIELQ